MPTRQYDYKDSDGAQYRMRVVGITESKEHWNEYTLEDGTILKVKLVVIQAGKSIDRPIPKSGGEPLYHVKTHSVVNAIVPEDQLIKDEGTDR